jgi:hypothetical protein
MTEKDSRRKRQAWKRGLEVLLSSNTFVSQRIVSLWWAGPHGTPADWTFEVVRNKLSNRMTVKYSFGPGFEIYGKVYQDPLIVPETHRVMSHLWHYNFSSNSFFRIPEPLSFIPEANLLLIRKVGGVPLSEIVASGHIDEAFLAVRQAAAWLVKFQKSQVPGLRYESPCEKVGILAVADAVAKVAAAAPEHSSHLIEMMHRLRAVVPTSNGFPSPVPMHGQFRPAHVLVEGQHVTVIDIEKVCLGDPAKDVARFCHTLKKTCLEQAGDNDRADELVQSFVSEYRNYCPREMENYSYFRALLSLKAYAKMLTRRKLEEHQRRAICEGHYREFERAVGGVSSLGRAA